VLPLVHWFRNSVLTPLIWSVLRVLLDYNLGLLLRSDPTRSKCGCTLVIWEGTNPSQLHSLELLRMNLEKRSTL